MNKKSKEYKVPKIDNIKQFILPVITLPDCPQCQNKENVKKIIYGNIGVWPEENNNCYCMGGCMPHSDNYRCISCGKDFIV